MKGLLFITHRNDRFGYIEGARAALEGGCRRVQLRMKDENEEVVLETAQRLREMCDSYAADLYIDDHVDIAIKAGAKGVHLGRNDMAPDQARRLMGPAFIIGGTANTFGDIVRLNGQGVDYIGLGPFRFTETKKNLSPVLGLGGYERMIGQCMDADIDLPVVAIGGITSGDIPAILSAGVSAIAVSSTILAAEDPVCETKRIIEIINNFQI